MAFFTTRMFSLQVLISRHSLFRVAIFAVYFAPKLESTFFCIRILKFTETFFVKCHTFCFLPLVDVFIFKRSHEFVYLVTCINLMGKQINIYVNFV